MTSYDITASVGVKFVDELHNFHLGLYVVEELEKVNANQPKSPEQDGGQAPRAEKSRPCVVKTMH